MEEALSLLSLCKEGSPERVREFLLANGNLDERLMVLVFRKTDGFHGEICPEWKKDKQKLETSF